jgi:hypothetical protein
LGAKQGRKPPQTNGSFEEIYGKRAKTIKVKHLPQKLIMPCCEKGEKKEGSRQNAPK